MAALGEDLLGIVNKLQDLVFNTIGNDSLDLPQIVVVGSQSSGKSSVLENIVGRDFLPRGSGIVTRRPLILQLINVPSEEEDAPEAHTAASVATQPEWAEFHHIPNRRFTEFQDIPINLKIYSPHVLSLTLVDLPGLTKVPIGDQPTDIEKQTRNLISEYIAKPNSIILAVSPANVDIVNSEALNLPGIPYGPWYKCYGYPVRQSLPLKLGFIGVVNRSQQDIQGNKTLSEALKSEADFFKHHPAYRNMATRCGTQFLAKSLNTTLMAHIRERLPDIKARLNTLMGQTQQELASYGDMHFSGKEHKGALILQLMTRFASSFIASIDGTSTEISTKELCGGARIYYIFNSVFGNSLETIDPTTNLSALDIRTAIRNSTGPRPSLFVPELAFDLLVKPQIKLLEVPSQRCVELVYEELIKICHTCGSTELTRFPRLQTKLIEVVSDLLRERLGPASQYVESLISIQRAYINTNHPNFLGAAAAMSNVVSNKQEKERRRLIQEEKERKEHRRRKELEAANGGETPEEEADAVPEKLENLPHRKHLQKTSRSMSPAIRENGTSAMVSSMNGLRGGSPPRFNGQAAGGARDSFLNYFFGKDGGLPGGAGVPQASSSAQMMGNPNLGRHVSQSAEPSITQSIRRQEERPVQRTPAQQAREDDYELGRAQRDYNYDSPFGNNAEPALTDREAMETELIRALISSYFNIVRESIADQVPKAVMHLLVNHSKDVVQNRLVSELYREDLFGELLYEDDAVKKEREKCEKLLRTYKEAAKIVGEVGI
ncbi:dynamin-related protein [Botrytis cinerea]